MYLTYHVMVLALILAITSAIATLRMLYCEAKGNQEHSERLKYYHEKSSLLSIKTLVFNQSTNKEIDFIFE